MQARQPASIHNARRAWAAGPGAGPNALADVWRLFVGGIDLARQPVLLLALNGVIRHANPPAEQLLANHKILTVVNDQIHLNRRAEKAQLRHAILLTARSLEGSGPPIEQIVILRDRQDRTVMILELRGIEGPGGAWLISVNIADLLAPTGIAPAWLSLAFGLTLAEARIGSALFDGLELRDIAERRGLALETVRNHLKRTLVKAGARSQSQLIRRMSVSKHCANSQQSDDAAPGEVALARSSATVLRPA